MSHDDTNVPPPSSTVQQFLAEHLDTGAPSADELSRLKARVLEHGAAAARETPRPPRRSWLPPEVLAVAALVAVAVVAQLIYLAVRAAPEPAAPASAAGVVAAYRQGDVQGALRLASNSCREQQCVALATQLMRALALTQRFEHLTAVELEELAALDEALSGGVETELTVAIRARRKPADPSWLHAEAVALEREGKLVLALQLVNQCLARAPAHADCVALEARLVAARQARLKALVQEASMWRKDKQLHRAVAVAETCIAEFPSAAVCYRLLGVAAASVAVRDGSAAARDRAKWAYERFVELAEPDDEYLPKVKALLEAAAEADRAAREKREERAAAPPLPPAQDDQATKDLYLRGYQLRDSVPEEARVLFKDVMTRTAPGSELHEKARHRLEELDGR